MEKINLIYLDIHDRFIGYLSSTFLSSLPETSHGFLDESHELPVSSGGKSGTIMAESWMIVFTSREASPAAL